ncbi:MAG: SH3 domain-containing protein [Amphiplicatus sp.]
MTVFRSIWLSFAALVFCATANANAREAREQSAYSTDILGISEEHLSPEHWISKIPDADAPFVPEERISALNERTFDADKNLVRLETLPDSIDRKTLETYIAEISQVPGSDRFTRDGRKLTGRDYKKYQRALNPGAVAEDNPVTFGLIVRRTSMRTFPTDDETYREGTDRDIDRFQETGLFPGQPVAILHASKDGKWVFAQSYNYRAWMKKADAATSDRKTVLDFASGDDMLLVTGAKAYTVYNPDDPSVSEVQLDMGTRLPLGSPEQYGHDILGQNPYATHIVVLPTANAKGALVLKPALIARSQDVSARYLAFTPRNVITQAFKFLGERYGWGHDYNGRDCTGFVSEVYKSMGILMPRNSGQQGEGSYGVNIRFDENTTYEEKLAAIKTLDPGDLIYIPGHVMMFLGLEDGVPYVIHDVNGYAHKDADGKFYRGVLNGVSVTPLTTLHLSEETRYIDRIYNLKKMR